MFCVNLRDFLFQLGKVFRVDLVVHVCSPGWRAMLPWQVFNVNLVVFPCQLLLFLINVRWLPCWHLSLSISVFRIGKVNWICLLGPRDTFPLPCPPDTFSISACGISISAWENDHVNLKGSSFRLRKLSASTRNASHVDVGGCPTQVWSCSISSFDVFHFDLECFPWLGFLNFQCPKWNLTFVLRRFVSCSCQFLGLP